MQAKRTVSEVLESNENIGPKAISMPNGGVFGIRKEFDDLENFLFGIKEPGAMTAFKTLTHIRARCYKMGMQVYGD